MLLFHDLGHGFVERHVSRQGEDFVPWHHDFAHGKVTEFERVVDHFFLGFPNYWNLVAFYLYCLGYGTTFNVTVLLIFGVMVFVPLRYIYPNRTVQLRPLTLTLGIIWGVVTVAMLLMLPTVNRVMLWAALSFIAYYFIASFALHARAAMVPRPS